MEIHPLLPPPEWLVKLGPEFVHLHVSATRWGAINFGVTALVTLLFGKFITSSTKGNINEQILSRLYKRLLNYISFACFLIASGFIVFGINGFWILIVIVTLSYIHYRFVRKR